MNKSRFKEIDMDYEKLSNKKFAYTMLDMLIKRGQLTDGDLNVLTNVDLCKNHFSCSKFPILSEVSLNSDLVDKDCYDEVGRQRYYKDKFIVNNRAFVVTNHWYGPNKSMADNRTPFMRWVIEKC